MRAAEHFRRTFAGEVCERGFRSFVESSPDSYHNRYPLLELYAAIPLLDYVLEVYVTLHMEGMHDKLKFVTDNSSYRCLSLDNFPSPPF